MLPARAPPKNRKLILLGAPTLSAVRPEDVPARTRASQPPPPSAASSTAGPSWRILHQTRKRLHTGLTQPADPGTDAATALADLVDESISHSLEMRTTPLHASTAASLADDGNSFLATPSKASDSVGADLPALVSMTDLEDLPSASSVARKPPHTVAITALVGVISIEPARTVQTRFGTQMHLVTLTVGDETAAGFRIDVWVHPRPPTAAGRELKSVVDGLRVQDVIVVRNISLNVFRDVLYGQTMGRGLSSVKLVHRVRQVDQEERRLWRCEWGESLAARKVGRVVDWVRSFVGYGGAAMVEGSEDVPDDTPTAA